MGSAYRTVADKLKLLRLAKEYGTVIGACDEMGFSRDSYYRIRKLYELKGKAGLKNMSRHRPLPKNRVKPLLEEVVLELTRAHLGWGQARLAEELNLGVRQLVEKVRSALRREHPEWSRTRLAQEVERQYPQIRMTISPTGVRGVWRRHGLLTRRDRGFVGPPEPRRSSPYGMIEINYGDSAEAAARDASLVVIPPSRIRSPAPEEEQILCPFCHKASGVPPFKCPRCGIGIPRHK
jgi:hypothetical protein